MKNLFKKMMLVAVAAMAFTACSQDVNEVNNVEKKTVISGVLTIENDDTRSVFLEKENENQTFYQSAWEGNEYIRLYFSTGFSDYAEVDTEGNFEIDYIGDFDPGTTVTICSPDDAWYSVDTFEIPSEQTPLANSVDPAAHILKSGATEIVNNTIWATMNHEAAYGKLTVNIPDVKVAKVELTINGGTKYTLDGANVVDNVFWFAAAEFTVNELIVKAYGANDKVYQKTITNPTHPEKGAMTFSKGRVSTFSVSNLEEQVNDVSVVKAVAGPHKSYAGETLVTFTLSSGDTFGIAFKTGDDNFIASGTWQGNSYSQPNYITYIYYNSVSISSYLVLEVSYADGMYTIAPFGAYDWNAGCNRDFPGYTGAIDGLAGNPSPGAGGEEPEQPEQPEVNVKEVEIDRLYAASYGSDYDLSFYIKNEGYDNILINVWAGTYNTSGTYSFAYNGDTSNGFANYSTHQYKGTPISSGELTVVVEGNNRTFDFVFVVNGETYHFNYTHVG